MSQRKVRDVIVRKEVVRLAADATVRSASQLMAEQGVGAVLVMKGDEIEGIFSERDALKRVLAKNLDPDGTTLAEVRTREMVTLDPDPWAVDALRIMSQVGIRHLPIVDQDKVIGMISLRDFIGAEFQLAGKKS
ncbi:MAG: CBS domain-containing protein [Gammaproteobacteria bacterium]|nr:CBS domain-containing protein [Gammaproteobacteria bacterium]MDH3411391.1 CBS domain-containing protein [Gammaproteobacteria bacterium]